MQIPGTFVAPFGCHTDTALRQPHDMAYPDNHPDDKEPDTCDRTSHAI